MQYRNFGRTGVKISPLSLGGWTFGDRTSAEEAYRMVDHAIAAGINCFDTANIYQRGVSEEILGEAIYRSGRRESLFVSTKLRGRMNDLDPNAQGLSRKHIIAACEASLRRLKTDYIDLFQAHRQATDTAVDEMLRAFDDLIRVGKVRYVGTSTFAAWQIVDALWASKEHHLHRFVSEQPPYSILDRRIERELIPMAQSYGLAILPWSPLAGGMLTGKYQSKGSVPGDSRLNDEKSNAAKLLKQKTGDEAAAKVIETLLPIANDKGCTLGQFSLAWCMHQPGITSPIMGPRNLEQLQDNLRALDIVITPEDCRRVDAIVAPGSVTIPYYDSDFGPNRYHW